MHLSPIKNYAPLLLVTAFSFVIKAYDPVLSPVLAALDPWGWTIQARGFLVTQKLDPFFTGTGYPPTFMYLIASIASLGIDPYDVVRYVPIVSAINVIPIYLLIFEIFRSHRISALGALLTVTSRFYFMRTSIGIPEGLAHFFFVFMLLFMLRAFRTKRSIYGALAAIFLAVSVLYYHFTVVIVIPLFAVLLFGLGLPKREAARVLATISVPALLISGTAWFFRVLPNMVGYYFGTRIYTYQLPVFERSLGGYLYLLAYSIGKSGAVALSHLGYAMTFLMIAGVTGVLLSRRVGKDIPVAVRFLLTYFVVLGFLALALRTVYNLGLAGAGDSSVYVFSWLALPVAAFASQAVMSGAERLSTRMAKMKSMSMRNISKTITISLIVLLVIANLSAVNYYKASAAGKTGILEAHYFYKGLTDEEYYALQYLRNSAPKDAFIFVVGVDQSILTFQATVAERSIISVRNITAAGEDLILDAVIVFPNLHFTNVTKVEMRLNAKDHQQIYLITGIRTVSLQVARAERVPPPSNALMEQFLLDNISRTGRYTQIYQNEQVTITQLFSTYIKY